MSVSQGLLVTIEAKPDKVAEVEELLRGAQSVVEREPGTVTWYAVRVGQTSFVIFDTFHDGAGRDAHLSGEVAAALQRSSALFSADPDIKPVDVLASKGA